jgi:hypothetical protein
LKVDILHFVLKLSLETEKAVSSNDGGQFPPPIKMTDFSIKRYNAYSDEELIGALRDFSKQ